MLTMPIIMRVTVSSTTVIPATHLVAGVGTAVGMGTTMVTAMGMAITTAEAVVCLTDRVGTQQGGTAVATPPPPPPVVLQEKRGPQRKAEEWME